MKLILNPKYRSLQSFVKDLPAYFETAGEIIQDRRNTIKVFQKNGLQINVKRYRVPITINRIIYTFFRKTKASKAYFNALEVLKRGFDTPEPIACIETFHFGLLHYSYYISLHCAFRQEMRDFYFGPLTGNEPILKAFAQYTAALHEACICHEDYSPGNVLVKAESDSGPFTLVDINRMKFMPMNLKKGCQNLKRMFESEEIYRFIGPIYAQSRGFNSQQCTYWMLYYNKHSLRRDRRKKKFKAFKKQIFK